MQLLTAKEVADRCKMPVEWVDTAASSGVIPPPICLDGHKRWREKDIDKWIETGCPPVRASEEPHIEAAVHEGGLDLGSIERKIIKEAMRTSSPIEASEESNPDGRIPKSGLDLRSIERKIVIEALRVSEGNRAQAARLLGIGERTVYRKLREYGVV